MSIGKDSPIVGSHGPHGPTHGLGPHVVGQRIVVRRLVRGEVGPSGGPALTDVLGVCTAWGDGVCVVLSDQASVVVPIADIVSGKPVPPRPSVRARVSPREAQLHGTAMWPDAPTTSIAAWVARLRVGDDRRIARACSVLAMGDPDIPLAEAAERAREAYAAIGLPAWAQVVADGPEEAGLRALGWTTARPGEADTLFEVVALSRLARALPRPGDELSLDVAGPRAVARLAERARAQGAIDADWLGLHDIWVDPSARRQGLARLVMSELVDWAASQGATTAYLQVRQDNAAALALYARLGFTVHHAYRYLAAPAD